MNMLGSFFKKQNFSTREVKPGEKLDNPDLYVQGMDCKHCKMNVEKHLNQIEGIESVEANFKSGFVNVQGKSVDIDKVREQVKELGYKLEGIIE